MIKASAAIASFLFLLLAARPAWSGIVIQADHLDVWHDKREALFTGHVHLTRDDFELFCDRLKGFYRDEGGIERAVATGHVHMRQGEKTGSADTAVLNNVRQLVILRGHAVMEQPKGRISGEVIIHHLKTRLTEVERGKQSRVRLRLDDAGAPDAPGAAK